MARLETVPATDLDDESWGIIEVHEEIARKNVRIFRQDGQYWNFTTNDHRFSREELTNGLKLGLIPAILVGPDESSVPMLQLRFNNEFDNCLHKADHTRRLACIEADDVWTRDFISSSMPGHDGLVVLKIIMRSSQGSRTSGQAAFDFRSMFGGAAYSPGSTRDEINSMGIVMTIPPYQKGSRGYPAGRIIAGSHGSHNPHVHEYFRVQEVQEPLILDADWLAIGCLDEFLQFVPVPNGKSTHGWALLIADPNVGLEMLERARNEGTWGHLGGFTAEQCRYSPTSRPTRSARSRILH
ncbi:hypothetical protein N8T08_006085 [Aspergillus melleus]|uniref:Uncharacterized protein n=1 Tax=Aspergillus melleus TaxID=138277 RepID=A0ACC3B0P3_9EURO|nr:hypothetical protein N8T08_006085 [Aspergillus melleus]